MQSLLAWAVILNAGVILLVDLAVYWFAGYEYTITEQVRDWAEVSAWPEAVFLVLIVILYAHLFRRFP